MKAKSIIGDEEAPDNCQRCGTMLVTIRYVNGQEVCGCCYADKKGYLAEEHPRSDRIEELSGNNGGENA